MSSRPILRLKKRQPPPETREAAALLAPCHECGATQGFLIHAGQHVQARCENDHLQPDPEHQPAA